MPQVNIPSVGLVNFPDSMSDDDITKAIQNNILKKAPEPNAPIQVGADAPDFTRGIANILPQLQSTYGSAKVLAGKTLGDKEMMKSGMEYMQAGEAKTQTKESDEFTNAWNKGIGTVLTDWLPYQAGAGVGSLLETLGMMGIGAVGGAGVGVGVGAIPGAAMGLVGKQLVKKGVKEAAEAVLKKEGKEAAEAFVENEAKKTLAEQIAAGTAKQGAKSYGTTAGIVGQAGLHGAGETTSRAIQEGQKRAEAEGREYSPEELELNRVLPAAIAHSIADFFSEKIRVGALSNIGGNASKSLVLDITKAVGVTGTKELLPETIQTIAERYGARLSLADADALKDYINTAAASYAMSVIPGGIGGARTHFATKPVAPTTEPTTEEIKTSEEKTVEEEVKKEKPNFTRKFDEQGNLIKAAETAPVIPPSALATQDETIPDFVLPSTQEKINTLKADNERIKNKLANGEYKTPAAIKNAEAKLVRQQTEIETLSKGETNEPRPNVAADRTSAEVSGEPRVEPPAAGVTPADIVGMDTANTIVTEPEKREGAQPSALETSKVIHDKKTDTWKYDNDKELIESVGPTSVITHKIGFAADLGIKKTYVNNNTVDFDFENGKTIQVKFNKGNTEVHLNKPDKMLGTRPDKSFYENGTQNGKDLFSLDKLKNFVPEQIYNAIQKTADSINKDNSTHVDPDKFIKPFLKEAVESDGYTKLWDTRSETNTEEEFKQQLKEPKKEKPKETTPIKQKTLEEELEDQAEAYFAEEPEEVVKKEKPKSKKQLEAELIEKENAEARLKYAPRTQREVMQNAQAIRMQQALTTKEIIEDNTLTEEEKDNQIAFNNYMIAANGDPKQALNLLTADIYANDTEPNPFLPNTGGEFAKNYYRSLKPEQKQQIDQRVKELEAQEKRKDEDIKKSKRKTIDEQNYIKSITENVYSKKELEILNKRNKEVIAKNKSETSKLEAVEKGSGGTTPKLMAHMLRGDLRGALREIVNDTTGAFTAFDKLIAKRLLMNDSLPALHVVEELDGHGTYNNGTDVVTIRQDSLESHTLLHEALHGFTVSYIRVNENSAVVKELNKLYEYLKTKHPELMDEYGMKKNDIAEFVSEVFSNRLFQERLNKIPYKSSSAIADFAKKVLQMLGISPNENYTAFAQALISTERILTEGRKFQTTSEIAKPEITKLETKKAEAEPIKPDAAYDVPPEQQSRNLRNLKRAVSTVPGIRRFITDVQNDRHEAKVLHEINDIAGKIVRSGKLKNNFYDWLTLSAGRAKDFYNSMVEEHYVELNNAINKIAKEKNLNTEKLLNYLHQYLEAKHEPERRRVKYIFTVPMTKEANARRVEILKILNTEELTKKEAQDLRAELEAIVNNKNNLDPLGEAPPGVFNKKPINDEQKAEILNENNSYYNVTGLNPEDAQAKVERFTKLLGQKNLDSISKPLQALIENTKIMNAESHYWSDPVENRANFYGWENYVPLKGINKASETDEFLDYGDDNKERLGTDLVKTAVGYSGRQGPGDNPILVALADATKAAMRAGRGEELTLSIKNAILDKIIPGTVNKATQGKPISFDERDSSDILQTLTKGNRFILNHNKDGSVDILEITDPKILEAIRRTYRTTNTLTDIANKITSGLGKMHTRYNFNFAPLNFVRDALTNAFNVGAKIGPFKAAEFLAKLSTDIVVRGGMGKAFNAARLYATPNGMEKLKQLAEKKDKNGNVDPIYKNMYDYIKQGGMVEYLQGMSIKSNFDQLNKKVGRSGIITKIEDVNKMLDIWNNMFELSSRSSAYAMMRDHYTNTEKLNEESAKTKAAAFVKNLANFEQVGKYGKELGAIYMFIRPSATGAVRALEAAAPAFQTLEMAKARLPNNIKNDPKALATWEKNYAFEQKSARYMIASLMGLGYLMFNMAKMMAPDDDLGRNKVLTDNMDQWNRTARFHFPFTDKVFQIPWAFGLGAFSASGAQLAGVMAGNGKIEDALRNIFTQIALDSFVPIPISRMKASDNPAAWVLDSVAPSFARPLLEFVINKNGLGQDIYNDSQRRMGDAYLGGDHIPKIYKDIAEYLNKKTLGAIDWSPNSIYFLSNSYMDGPAKAFLELPTSVYAVARGEKELSTKTDVPFIGSFVGTTSSVDTREFAEYDKKIKEMAKTLSGFEKNNLVVEQYKYLAKHPLAEVMVETYDKGTAELNELRNEANEIRRLPVDQKTIDNLLKANKFQQSLIQNELVSQFKAYDIEGD